MTNETAVAIPRIAEFTAVVARFYCVLTDSVLRTDFCGAQVIVIAVRVVIAAVHTGVDVGNTLMNRLTQIGIIPRALADGCGIVAALAGPRRIEIFILPTPLLTTDAVVARFIRILAGIIGITFFGRRIEDPVGTSRLTFYRGQAGRGGRAIRRLRRAAAIQPLRITTLSV